jgi:hypothetical protein
MLLLLCGISFYLFPVPFTTRTKSANGSLLGEEVGCGLRLSESYVLFVCGGALVVDHLEVVAEWITLLGSRRLLGRLSWGTRKKSKSSLLRDGVLSVALWARAAECHLARVCGFLFERGLWNWL